MGDTAVGEVIPMSTSTVGNTLCSSWSQTWMQDAFYYTVMFVTSSLPAAVEQGGKSFDLSVGPNPHLNPHLSPHLNPEPSPEPEGVTERITERWQMNRTVGTASNLLLQSVMSQQGFQYRNVCHDVCPLMSSRKWWVILRLGTLSQQSWTLHSFSSTNITLFSVQWSYQNHFIISRSPNALTEDLL